MVAVLMQRDDGGASDDGAQQPSPSSSMFHRHYVHTYIYHGKGSRNNQLTISSEGHILPVATTITS